MKQNRYSTSIETRVVIRTPDRDAVAVRDYLLDNWPGGYCSSPSIVAMGNGYCVHLEQNDDAVPTTTDEKEALALRLLGKRDEEAAIEDGWPLSRKRGRFHVTKGEGRPRTYGNAGAGWLVNDSVDPCENSVRFDLKRDANEYATYLRQLVRDGSPVTLIGDLAPR